MNELYYIHSMLTAIHDLHPPAIQMSSLSTAWRHCANHWSSARTAKVKGNHWLTFVKVRSYWGLASCWAWQGIHLPVLWSSLHQERSEWLHSALCDHKESWCSPHSKCASQDINLINMWLHVILAQFLSIYLFTQCRLWRRSIQGNYMSDKVSKWALGLMGKWLGCPSHGVVRSWRVGGKSCHFMIL